MTMRIEVGPVSAVGLQRQDETGADVGAAEQGLKGFQYRGIGGLGQQSQQGALALEQASQHPWDGKGPVTVRDRGENPGELFGKQDGAFGLTAGAKIPCATRERQ